MSNKIIAILVFPFELVFQVGLGIYNGIITAIDFTRQKWNEK